MKAIVVINEQHRLLQQQESVLQEKFEEGWDLLKVPAEGLPLDKQQEVVDQLLLKQQTVVVFVSPIPFVLGRLCRLGAKVMVFNNDRREKVELPDGRIISRLAADGWQLVDV